VDNPGAVDDPGTPKASRGAPGRPWKPLPREAADRQLLDEDVDAAADDEDAPPELDEDEDDEGVEDDDEDVDDTELLDEERLSVR
jgi:hypothetical protein